MLKGRTMNYFSIANPRVKILHCSCLPGDHAKQLLIFIQQFYRQFDFPISSLFVDERNVGRG
jgi:hypothetical protein